MDWSSWKSVYLEFSCLKVKYNFVIIHGIYLLEKFSMTAVHRWNSASGKSFKYGTLFLVGGSDGGSFAPVQRILGDIL
jgi:hypothetical protein